MARRTENLPTGGDDAVWAEVGGVLRKHGHDPALLIASLATKKDGKIVCVTADRATGSSGCLRTVAEAIELGYAHAVAINGAISMAGFWMTVAQTAIKLGGREAFRDGMQAAHREMVSESPKSGCAKYEPVELAADFARWTMDTLYMAVCVSDPAAVNTRDGKDRAKREYEAFQRR